MPLKEVSKFCISYLQILDQEGKVDRKLDPGLAADELVELYERMALARSVDQRMLKLQRQGRLGTCPLCTGQEAAVCGPAFAMTAKDWFVGYYRELGARLMRGQSLVRHFRYWFGQEEGSVQPTKDRTVPVTAIIGAQVLHAVGIAYAAKYRGESDSAVVAFFGDGATSQGDVHEAMNFAAVWQAPVVFICLNNQFAISQPVDKQTRSQTIAQKAIAYGFEGIQVDGNDVLAMYRATQAALDRAKSGGGPTLIEAITYRLMMHTTADDPRRYRDDGEVESWWGRDPIPRMRRYMEERKLWSPSAEEDMQRRIRSEVDRAVEIFESETKNDLQPDAPFEHLYGATYPDLEKQRSHFLFNVARTTPNG